MQIYNENDLKESFTADTENEMVSKLKEELNRDDITHVIIGKMPKKGKRTPAAIGIPATL